jgi:pimeloyl-[acyl-carrier protein] methyl ester esterase
MKAPLELLLLHALPLDGSMWAAQMGLLPGATHAPTLYPLGDGVEEWASALLRSMTGERLVIVGCSVGGSCALEIAAAAPERIAALVLVGTKAKHHPDPALHAGALAILERAGMEEAWRRLWAPLLSPVARQSAADTAKRIALCQSPGDVARGVSAFHIRASRERTMASFPRPIVIVCGADDPAPGPKVSALQAASTQAGCLRIIPACGHYAPLERPAALNAILRQVIAAVA